MRSLLSVLGLAMVAAAAETPENLVKQLGSASYAEREAAGAELLKLGIAALPAVKAAAETSPDAEVRERAASLLEPLSRLSDSQALLAVKSIRLESKAVALSTLIADFKTKTGIPVQLVSGKVADPSRLITIAAGDYEPWAALELILKVAGLREDHRLELPGGKEPVIPTQNYRSRYYDDGIVQQPIYTPATAPILLVDGPPDKLAARRAGGIRVLVLPTNFQANKVVRGAGRVVFHLDVAPVPSTGWSQATGIRILAAEDDEGRPVFADLRPPSDPFANQNDRYGWNGRWGGGRRVVMWGGGGMLNEEYYGNAGPSPYLNPRLVPVAIRTGDRLLTKLRRFDGVVLGEVYTPNAPVITIDNLERSTGVPFQGPLQSTFVVQEIKKQENGTHTVRYRYDTITSWALQQMGRVNINSSLVNDNLQDVIAKIKYYDADGQELKAPTTENSSTNSDGMRQNIDVTVRFPKTNKPPVKLVLIGTRVTAVEVPFNLTDVNVP